MRKLLTALALALTVGAQAQVKTNLAGPGVYGTLPVTKGGTGYPAANIAALKTYLGLGLTADAAKELSDSGHTFGYDSSIGWTTTDNIELTGSGQFLGSGAGLSDIPDAALSANVPLKNAANAFTNTVTYQPGAAYDTAALGAERLDATTWTLGAGWAYVSGSDWTFGFKHTAGNTATLEQSDTCTNGGLYRVAWTISGMTAGTIAVTYGGLTSGNVSATGSIDIKTISTAKLIVTPTTDFDGTVVLSVKSITPSSPTLSIKDNSGTSNYEVRSSTASLSDTMVGTNSGRYITSGSDDAFFGASSGQYNTTGVENAFFGSKSGQNNSTGSFNTFLGFSSGYGNYSGNNNTFVGRFSGYSISTGSGNVGFGRNSAYSVGTGNYNTCLGYYAMGGASSNLSGVVCLGAYAGKYGAASNEFYVNNKDQTNTATEKSNSLLYGVMGASATAQTLQVAGKLKVDPSAGTYAAPTEALDVVGNIKASGGVTANTFPLIQWRGSSASDPTTNLTEGQMYWNTGGNLKIYTGSAWVIVGVGP